MKEKTKKNTTKKVVGVDALVSLPNEILIEVDEHKKLVLTKSYIMAKTKQLQEFGYTTLTEQETTEQLKNILDGDKPLSIIGQFMVGEIVRSN